MGVRMRMKNITTAVLVLTLIGPSFALAEFAGAKGHIQFVMSEQRVRGFPGQRGKRFGVHKRGRGFHRGDLTRYFYYRYPRYFYRNYGGIRKFYPRENRSDYPNQGGSDYRDWFHFPRR
jgi:hypothetical protein